jgi:hypothetical protein
MDMTSRSQHGCAPCPAPHQRIVLSFPTTFLIKLDSSHVGGLFGSSFANEPNLSFSFMSNRHFPMSRLASKWTCIPIQFATGGGVGQPAILLCLSMTVAALFSLVPRALFGQRRYSPT